MGTYTYHKGTIISDAWIQVDHPERFEILRLSCRDFKISTLLLSGNNRIRSNDISLR